MVTEDCESLIRMIDTYKQDGLPDDMAKHVEGCAICHGSLLANRTSFEALHALWHAKEPERKARLQFSADCKVFYKTWRGWLYLTFGGGTWTRRAKWLGLPRWDDYKPQ